MIENNFPAPDPQSLATAMGIPLFTTDLHMPAYHSGEIGRWKIVHAPFGMDHGYFSGPCAISNMPVLMRNVGDDTPSWETWMSLSCHEIESQEFGCRNAYGHTVVMGLGMGWVAINAALNSATIKVTIIERDPEVIALFQESGAQNGLTDDVLAKLNIVQADALLWQPTEPVDFLYADIWLTLAEPETLDQIRQMQTNVQAKEIYYWGQELTIHDLAKSEEPLTEDRLEHCIKQEINLPLLTPPNHDYSALIDDIICFRRQRGLPLHR